MKILYTTLHHPYFAMGGAEQILLDLTLAMKREYGCEVIAAVNEGSLAEKFRKEGISIAPLYWSKLETPQTLKSLKNIIREFQPDWIHAFHRYPAFLLEVFLKEKERLLYTEEVLRKDKKMLFRYGRRAIACHETVRLNLIDFYKVPQQDVLTIPNAICSRQPDIERVQALRGQYPRKSGEIWGLCIGRLEEQKGHPYLIEAISKLPESYRGKIRIFLAGDGSKEQALKRQAQALGCGNLVFLGHTAYIPEWLALSDFMVLPSLWEGLPLSILEAYSAAKPVIATDIPGSRESVEQGKTGLLVKPADSIALRDALLYFADHPAEVFHLGREAYNVWQENFSFEQMTEAYYGLYKKLLAEKVPHKD